MSTQLRKDQIADAQIGDNHVDPTNKITEAKLSLNYPTHSTANDPTADQKAALDNAPNALSATNPVADKTYVDNVASGAEWQNSIIDKNLTAPPVSPLTGDRYLIAATATGVWAGHDNEITEYNGTTWDFYVPSIGWAIYADDEGVAYVQTASVAPWTWTQFTGVSDTTPGAGLTRAGQALDVGAGFGIIVNADDVEVVYEADNPVNIGSATPGVVNEAARGDHVHGHGNQGGSTEHAAATGAVNGFMPSSDKSKLDAMPGTRAIEDFDSTSQTIFILAVAPASDAYCTVYKNGVRQRLGAGNDYIRSGVTVTFNTTVGSGQVVSAEYWY